MQNIRDFLHDKLKNIKSEFSLETLVSIALHEISKNDYFKDNYTHFDLIENNKEYRVLSNDINNISGLKNSNSSKNILNPKKDYEEDFLFFKKNDNIENEYNDDFEDYEDYEEEIDLTDYNPLFSQRKIDNINEYLDILINSNNLNEIRESVINSNLYILKDFKQSNDFIFNNPNESFNSVRNVSKLLSNLLIYEVNEGHYKYINNRSSFGGTNARDIFNINDLGIIVELYDQQSIKKLINKSKLWSLSGLFIDQEGNIPKKISDIFEDENQDNWNAVILFSKQNKEIYKNKLFNIAFSTNEKINKKELVFDYLLKKTKKNIIKESLLLKNKFKSKNEIINKVKKHIKPILMEAEDLYFNNKNINDYSIENYSLKVNESDYNSKPQVEILNSVQNNVFNFCGEKFIDSPVKGFSYCGYNSFSSISKRENLLVVLKNKNEIIGFGSLYLSDSKCLQVNIVNIAKHMRGKGLLKPIYNEFCKYAKEKNLPIMTTHYTELGRKTIPKLKKSIIESHKDILWLDHCTNPYQSEKEIFLTDVSSYIINKFDTIKDSVTLQEARTIYDDLVEKIDDNIFSKENEMNFSLKYKAKESFMNEFGDKIDSFIKLKNKSKNKKRLKP